MAKKLGQASRNSGSIKAGREYLLLGSLDADQHRQVLVEMTKQTDRGTAVIGASFLEWKVRQAIKMRLPSWDKLGESLFGNDLKNGRIEFLDQCKIAYCLQLVGPTMYRDLERIAQIRNRFAHNITVGSFGSDNAVMERCKAFESTVLLGKWEDVISRFPKQRPTKRQLNDLLRSRFEVTVRTISLRLSLVVSGQKVKWPKLKAWEHLVW